MGVVPRAGCRIEPLTAFYPKVASRLAMTMLDRGLQLSASPAPVWLRPPSGGDGQSQNDEPTWHSLMNQLISHQHLAKKARHEHARWKTGQHRKRKEDRRVVD
jgi:hypothetical protein